MKKAIIFIFLLVLVLVAGQQLFHSRQEQEGGVSREYSEEPALVRHVVDGDTIILDDMTWVRYIGIDTPEIARDEISTPGECFGEEARQRNEELVAGKTIRLEKDTSNRDKYDRLLRYVWVDDVLVNEVLVREGFARTMLIPPDIKYAERLLEAESDAKKQSRGVWDACKM